MRQSIGYLQKPPMQTHFFEEGLYFMRTDQAKQATPHGGVRTEYEQIHSSPASASTRRDYGKPNERAQQDAVA